MSTSFSAKPNNLTLKKIRAAYYSDMNMKKYIAGSFDSLRIKSLKPHSNGRLRIKITTKNLTFAQFLQNEVKLTCKNLTKNCRTTRGYFFSLTKTSIQQILNYCGEYIVNHQDMVNKFCKNENITKPNYKKHIDDRDYLAGIFDSIMNFNLHRGSDHRGRYDYYVKLIKFTTNSQYITSFLINNNISHTIHKRLGQYSLHTKHFDRTDKLFKLILQNLISKKEIATEFINLPQKVDLATGNLFKEKIQFKIHPSITPKKGLTSEQSAIEAQKRKAAREKQKQQQKQEEQYFKEYREFLLALYNEQKKESKAYASQKKQKLRKAQEKQARKQAKLDKINSTHRFCKQCNTEKPKTEFYANPKILYGCDNVCKKCRGKENSQYYAQNTEKCKASAKNWRKNNPDKVKAYKIAAKEFDKKFRKLAKTHNFTFFTGRGVKKQEYDKYLEQEYLKLPQKIKEDHNLPQILSAKEIFDLRSKSILHFDHIFPKAYIYKEVEQGEYENYTISPHVYKNLRPFPGKLNESRLDKLEYLDYYSESELQDKKNAVFKL